MAALVEEADTIEFVDPRTLPDEERLAAFGKAIDAVRRRVEADLGEEDLAWIRRVDRTSRVLEVVGRGLIHFSLEPVSWSLGVVALWLHKQLQATEVGHTVLHGAFDKIEGAGRYHSDTWWWEVPIDEEAWHEGHNLRHHQHTNIAGKDPDIHFGPVRLTEHTPHHGYHERQLPYLVGFIWPAFGFTMNMHFTGLTDLYVGNGRPEGSDFLPDRHWRTLLRAHRRALRKFVPYYAKEYVLFPALAGPLWWKVALGNAASEVMRDLYTAATILCGHVGEETAAYPEGTRARGKGAWYAMQVEASNDFEVPLPISILCGALDRQIEHHLFPRFPTNRLRQIAPEVRAICEAHGVRYRTGSWGEILRGALRRVGHLARPLPGETTVGSGRALVRG
ncbi:MAG: fatty acid desaturase [Alphaproteobacteria bacterium]|nr:fatty acid desaturase [Alphaproteobacteria bacterium]